MNCPNSADCGVPCRAILGQEPRREETPGMGCASTNSPASNTSSSEQPPSTFDVSQTVTAGWAPIDDRDRQTEGSGVAREPVAGEHRQRRAGHRQCLSLGNQRICVGHNLLRNALAEEDDIGLERAGAGWTVEVMKRRGIGHRGDDGVGIGSHRQAADRFGAFTEPGVERFQLFGSWCGRNSGTSPAHRCHAD